jgi:GT2 family glycosyltransferase
MPDTISAIVPTIGRVESLAVLLDALAAQTRRPDEIIVADGSTGAAVEALAADRRWVSRGLDVRYLRVLPPNAVRQRSAAIEQSTGSRLLLLDDDVVPEPDCIRAMIDCLDRYDAVAVGANFSNHDWPRPTTLWRWYLRAVHGISGSAWQGRVIGPLLRFGYSPTPAQPSKMEWIGSGHSLIRRDAFTRAGGFSDFFLHRSTVNEDVDLGLKLARIGPIYLCPDARMAHLHVAEGRLPAGLVAEDDLYNRYAILRRTLGHSRLSAFALAFLYFAFETVSGLLATARHLRNDGFSVRLAGRLRALARIATAS